MKSIAMPLLEISESFKEQCYEQLAILMQVERLKFAPPL